MNADEEGAVPGAIRRQANVGRCLRPRRGTGDMQPFAESVPVQPMAGYRLSERLQRTRSTAGTETPPYVRSVPAAAGSAPSLSAFIGGSKSVRLRVLCVLRGEFIPSAQKGCESGCVRVLRGKGTGAFSR